MVECSFPSGYIKNKQPDSMPCSCSWSLAAVILLRSRFICIATRCAARSPIRDAWRPDGPPCVVLVFCPLARRQRTICKAENHGSLNETGEEPLGTSKEFWCFLRTSKTCNFRRFSMTAKDLLTRSFSSAFLFILVVLLLLLFSFFFRRRKHSSSSSFCRSKSSLVLDQENSPLIDDHQGPWCNYF